MILLDTHVVAWAANDSKRLSRGAVSAIRRARRGGGLAVSAITVWELALLVSRGKVQSYGSVEAPSAAAGRFDYPANHARNCSLGHAVS